MSIAAIGLLGVALLLVLIFLRVPIAVALALVRAARLCRDRRLARGADDVRPRALYSWRAPIRSRSFRCSS